MKMQHFPDFAAQRDAQLYLPACVIIAPRPDSVSNIIRAVAFNTGLSADQIASHDRRKHLSRARFAAYWLVRRITDKSLAQIGVFFQRDRTTILHGLGRAEQFRDDDPAFALMTDRLLTAFFELKGTPHGACR